MSEEKEVTPEDEYSDAFNEFASDEEPKELSGVNEDTAQEEPAIEDEAKEVNWQERAETLEAESKDWEHKFHSDAGRVAAMQRKINEMESSQQIEQTPPKQAAEEVQESPPELAEFKDDYPDIYQGVEKYMETEMQRRADEMQQQFQQQLAPVNQMMQQQTTAAEMAALNAQHPDWQQIANDTNFQSWAATQPQQIQEMANSDYASDVSYVLDSFKTQTQTQQPQKRSAVNGLAQKRERQLANASGVPSRNSSSTTPLAEDDYHSAFNYYAAKQK